MGVRGQVQLRQASREPKTRKAGIWSKGAHGEVHIEQHNIVSANGRPSLALGIKYAWVNHIAAHLCSTRRRNRVHTKT